MKIEIERLVIENDRLKEIKLWGEEYLLTPKTQVEKPKTRRRCAGGIDLGPKVSFFDNLNIYQKPLEEIRQVSNEAEGKNVLRKYHPNAKDISLKRYYNSYKSFIRNKKQIINPVTQQLQKIYKKRHYRKRPEGAVEFDKTYHLWVKEENIQKIKLGINKFGLDYKPNSKTLQRETGLPINVIMSTLKYMTNQGMIQKVRTKENKGKSIIYQPVLRIGEQ